MKYLFEMVGLYPAVTQEDSKSQESLAQLLLDQLGAAPIQPSKRTLVVEQKSQTAIP
jgi:hypothetical protein